MQIIRMTREVEGKREEGTLNPLPSFAAIATIYTVFATLFAFFDHCNLLVPSSGSS